MFPVQVYTYDRWKTLNLPAFAVGQTFVPCTLECVQGSTTVRALRCRLAPCTCARRRSPQAPLLLSESDLIALMDRNGIGTDATIAEHINTIQKRE